MAGSPLETYQHQALKNPSTQLRLLWIKATDSPYDLINCELHTQELNGSSYIAFQILFEDVDNQDHVVLCNGELCSVTKSTYIVLRHLCDNEPHWIWLPSLCLDRNNIVEYQKQIVLQPEILAKAIRAFSIWAGEEFKYSPLSDHNTIRLLELDPAQDYCEKLRFRLCDVPLESAFELDQSQYTYLIINKELTEGGWPDSETVICNGRRLHVTRHLDAALRTARAEGAIRNRLFVESISVNQADNHEVQHFANLDQRIREQAHSTQDMSPPFYNHKPLKDPATHIRLLRITASQSFNDPLIVDIQEFSLNSAPEFAALSYTWGLPSLDNTVVFASNGSLVPAWPNLCRALRHLREQGYSLIWADAACINQKDNDERNQQVLLMGNIYRRAKRVVIDLGIDCQAEQVHRQCSVFPQALVKMLALTHGVLHAVRPGDCQLKPADYAKFGIPSETHLAWRAWQRLRARPWFTRSWIVQEAVAGPISKVNIIYNRRLYRWSDLLGANIACKGERLDMKSYIGNKALGNMGILQTAGPSQQRYTLLDLVRTFRSLSSTDPRDKLYAFRGLASDQHLVPLPDYSKSEEAVYHEFATYFVSQGQGMQLLCEAGTMRSARSQMLPSWIADWSFDENWKTMNFNNQSLPSLGQGYSNHAVLSLEQALTQFRYPDSEVRLSQDPNVISASGVGVDTFLVFGSKVPNLRDENGTECRVDRARRLLVQARELIHDNIKVRERYGPSLEGVLKKTMAGGEAIDDSQRVSVGSDILDSSKPPDPYPRDSCGSGHSHKELDNVIVRNLGNRCFGVTQHGYIGLFPRQTEVGDILAILKGAKAPFVLRPMAQSLPTSHVLIGDAYVQGMMQGNGMEMLELDFKEMLIQ